MPVERDYWVATDDVHKNFDELLMKPTGKEEIKKVANRHGGSSMIETRRFGSGVFYYCYCIDFDLLFDNMSGAYQNLDAERVAEICAQLTGYFTMAAIGENPQGYQTSLTRHATAEVVAAGISTGFPNSAAGAFQNAIEPDKGFLKPSITRLQAWLEEKQAKHGEWVGKMKTAGFAAVELTMPELVSQLAAEAHQSFIQRGQ